MEIIKLDRVVSVNNELQGHAAKNILDGEISLNRNWMCEKGTEKAVVILQLERAAILTSVHIGNAHSAFVEVLVGKAADSSDVFESLIPMSVFMNPQESKTGTNQNRTRLFNKSDFNPGAASKSWDRIKVVCSQPFNKHVAYGLCFLRVCGEKELKKGGGDSSSKSEEKEGKKSDVLKKSEEDDEIEIGSFFKKKRSSAEDRTLTVGEQIREANKDVTMLQPTSHKILDRLESMKKKQEEKSEEKKTKRKNDENVEERKKRDEKKPDNKRTNDGGDEKTPKRKKQEKEKRKKKPFGRLMEDVVLVISGFKNPLRANIRSMALEMGARYSGDWEPYCTHLVCAYDNTPKFHQVKGKGKIVKKDWVEKCHIDRKRYPWRRFALDKMDFNKTESEEEIDAGEESEPEEQVAGSSKSDTVEGSKPKNVKSGNGDYDVATDDEEEKTVNTSDYPMPFLPDIFSKKTFYIEPSLKTKATLERYIVAYNGVITEAFHENVDFYVTDKGGAPVELFRKKAPNLVAIKPSWIWEINSKQKCIPTTPHLVN